MNFYDSNITHDDSQESIIRLYSLKGGLVLAEKKKNNEDKIMLKVLERASGLLHLEGFKEYYDGDDADIFWSAERELDKSIELIKRRKGLL